MLFKRSQGWIRLIVWRGDCQVRKAWAKRLAGLSSIGKLLFPYNWYWTATGDCPIYLHTMKHFFSMWPVICERIKTFSSFYIIFILTGVFCSSIFRSRPHLIATFQICLSCFCFEREFIISLPSSAQLLVAWLTVSGGEDPGCEKAWKLALPVLVSLAMWLIQLWWRAQPYKK